MTHDDYERTSAAWQRAQADAEQDAAMDDEFAEEREGDALDRLAEEREAWFDEHWENEQP